MVRLRMRHYLIPVLILAFCLLSVPAAGAAEWGEVYLKESQPGPLLLTGTRITVDTDIQGDVYLLAEEIVLRGAVKGDVFCLANKVTIDGRVDGDIRMLAGEMELNAPCTGTVTALGDSFWLWQDASSSNIFVATGSAQLNGTVDGSLRGQTDRTYINGIVTGKTDIRVNQQLSLGEKASLQGGLTYESPVELKKEAGATIQGAPSYRAIAPPDDQEIHLTEVLISWLAALVVWWLAGALKPAIWQHWGNNLARHPWMSLFLGALTMLMLPPLLLLLLFSVVGIPAALILAVMTVVVGYLGRIVVAVGFSIYMVQSVRMKPGIAIMVALIPLVLLTYLPGVGIMFVLTYGCLGLGSLLYTLRFKRSGQEFNQVV